MVSSSMGMSSAPTFSYTLTQSERCQQFLENVRVCVWQGQMFNLKSPNTILRYNRISKRKKSCCIPHNLPPIPLWPGWKSEQSTRPNASDNHPTHSAFKRLGQRMSAQHHALHLKQDYGWKFYFGGMRQLVLHWIPHKQVWEKIMKCHAQNSSHRTTLCLCILWTLHPFNTVRSMFCLSVSVYAFNSGNTLILVY